MIRDRLRAHVVGERPRSIPLGFAVGVVVALALELVLAVLGTGPGFAVLTVVTYVLGAAGLTRLVFRWSGGLVTVWAAVFPPMVAFAWRLFSYVGPGPGIDQLLGPAVAYTLGLGTVLYVLGAAAQWALRRAGLSSASENPAEEGVAGTVRRNRRAVLVGSVGGAMLMTAGVGHALGWWCRAEPADCHVDNELPRTVDARLTVRRADETVFTASPSLGPAEATQVGSADATPDDARFESAVPLGCSFPATVTVSVEADERSATETVTFPEPDLSPAESLHGSDLDIRVVNDDIEIEANNSIAIA
ncbi:hypothetical protein [Halosimplex pelagicum]|uniref:Uncharacterized protein n=1 Tax=Halosimplex pelagicum TaxID=869886 RepID=A0A7D5SY58_9EURY|nr:hypothetical protein [Halosimplex pelagicum]QLH84507.1 hypothetical protein HZS54_23955 [Halosimplex pelagicum]